MPKIFGSRLGVTIVVRWTYVRGGRRPERVRFDAESLFLAVPQQSFDPDDALTRQ
jgi:hypothetical protein